MLNSWNKIFNKKLNPKWWKWGVNITITTKAGDEIFVIWTPHCNKKYISLVFSYSNMKCFCVFSQDNVLPINLLKLKMTIFFIINIIKLKQLNDILIWQIYWDYIESAEVTSIWLLSGVVDRGVPHPATPLRDVNNFI